MQQELVDFSDCETRINLYGGAAYKFPIRYRGDQYLLKFGEKMEPRNADQTSYMNSPLSEHVGSQCFKALGVRAQKTILGTYKGHSVVACRDFIHAGGGDERYSLLEFKRLERAFVGWTSRVLKMPQIGNIAGVFDSNPDIARIADEAESAYWQMFLCDALLANFDRHAGNWGYILDRKCDLISEVAPVYDCGACLTPRLSEKAMARIASSPAELRERALAFPHACILIGGKRPTYQEFFDSPASERCLRVARDFIPSMNLASVCEVINGTPGLSDLRKEYLCKTVQSRFDLLLAPIAEKRGTARAGHAVELEKNRSENDTPRGLQSNKADHMLKQAKADAVHAKEVVQSGPKPIKVKDEPQRGKGR